MSISSESVSFVFVRRDFISLETLEELRATGLVSQLLSVRKIKKLSKTPQGVVVHTCERETPPQKPGCRWRGSIIDHAKKRDYHHY